MRLQRAAIALQYLRLSAMQVARLHAHANHQLGDAWLASQGVCAKLAQHFGMRIVHARNNNLRQVLKALWAVLRHSICAECYKINSDQVRPKLTSLPISAPPAHESAQSSAQLQPCPKSPHSPPHASQCHRRSGDQFQSAPAAWAGFA